MKAIVIFTTYLVASTAFGAAVAAKTNDVSWMAGHWQGQYQGSPMEAFYSNPDGGMILGMTKIASGKTLSFFEFERIEESENTLVLKPMPFANSGVEFTLKELSEKRAVFDHPGHDFPERIIYELQENGQLLGRIEGTQNGQAVAEDFLFTKVP